MKNYARKRWSDEDDQFLIDNADSMTISDAASALNRTYSSIQQRAARIGVKLIESDKNNKLTQEDVRFIVENGDTMTVSEMASALSRSTQTIENAAERRGVTTKKRPHHAWADEELAELKELVEAGFYYEDIARHFGVTHEAVSRKAHAMCLTSSLHGVSRSHKRWGIDETRQLVHMYERGDNITDICEKLGRSEPSVRRKARCLGLLRPDMR